MIFLSLLLSVIYWYLSRTTDENRYTITKMIFKISSLIAITDVNIFDIDNLSTKYIILFFYLLGDIIIIWDEITSIPLFIIGHIICLLYYMINFPWIVGYWLIMTPYMIMISYVVYIILQSPHIIYFIYTYILLFVMIIPVMMGYYGFLLMIISDVLIISRIEDVQIFTWPLYYLSVYMLCNYWQ